MKLLKKLFKLPSPTELGWPSDALESELISDKPKGKTWEEWDRTVKKLHPIKYFFAEVVSLWLSLNVFRPVKEVYYWTVSHVVPSRRYHILDLRQPHNKEGVDNYRYGWADVPEKMLYAMFNLLEQYFQEEPYDLLTDYSQEEIDNDPSMKAQQEVLVEARKILHWWKTERKEQYYTYYKILNSWARAKKEKSANQEELYMELKDIEKCLEDKTQEMLIRLVNIRASLWT